MNHPDMQRLVSLFGSAAEIARITGSSRSAVARWGRYKIAEDYQKALIEASYDKDLDPYEVAHAMGMERCPVCGTFHLYGKPAFHHKDAQS
jgi:hypothetical protein